MDFAFTEDEERFRAELRAFLTEELPDWWRGMFVDDPRAIPFTRAFCRKLAARGWLTMSWPRAWGGQEASVWKQAILREEMWAHDEPRGPQYMNLNYIGPCIMRFGSEAQKRRFLPPMAAGDVLWTQGFSEPGAGSDLAAVATRAEARGDHLVVNGHKLWSSYADAPADWCFLLARTSVAARRHEGLSILLVDMRTPGITVRPIDSMAGPHELNEMFFDEVRVPRDCLLGAEGQGWEIVSSALVNERSGIAGSIRFDQALDWLKTTAREQQKLRDPRVRQQVADLATKAAIMRWAGMRALTDSLHERMNPHLSAAMKLMSTSLVQEFSETGMEVLGPWATLMDDPHLAPGGRWAKQFLFDRAMTIAGGTSEVQRNIVAQRVLGLPRK